MPCAGLHTMVPTQGQSKQELCLPALFLGVWGGIRGSSWEQRSYGRNGATLTLPAPNRKQAPSPASTSAPDLLAGASGTARDGSGWGCGRRCVPPG